MRMCQVRSVRAAFHPGVVLHLSPDQVRDRAHNLASLGDGRYEVRSALEFCQGEILGVEGEIPLALLTELEVEDGMDVDPERMDQPQLLAFAHGLGLTPHPKTGKSKLLEMIRAREDERHAEQQARIAELEAKGEDLTEEERAELAQLKG